MSIKLIECKYGKHLTEELNFTLSGLNNKYPICKKCNCEKTKKYRQLNKEKCRQKHNEYQNKRRAEKRCELIDIIQI
jgi:hypothetical protein